MEDNPYQSPLTHGQRESDRTIYDTLTPILNYITLLFVGVAALMAVIDSFRFGER